MRICRNWKDRVMELSREIWRSGEHPWKGKPHSDTYLEGLITRINEIFSELKPGLFAGDYEKDKG